MKLKINKSVLKEAVRKILIQQRQQYPRHPKEIEKDMMFIRGRASSQSGADRRQSREQLQYLQQQLTDANKEMNEK